MLRGLFAAEGYIEKSKSGAIGRVGISSCSAHNKKLIISLLKLLGITSSIQDNAIKIYSKLNFNKIIEYDLLKISKDKEEFNKLYNNLKYKKENLIKI